MSAPYRVIVMTSDNYLPALRPFAYLFNKYWQPHPEVLIAGFSPPGFELPTNFKFKSIGKFSDFPFSGWSNALIKLLEEIQDETFVLMLEDYWITRPVGSDTIQILNDYAVQFGYVLKIDICTDRLYAYGADLNYGNVSYIDLVKSMPGSPYHMSLYPGIWRRDNLLKVLVPGESPHDLEIVGSTRVSHMQDLLVLGTRQNPLKITLGLRGGNHNQVNYGDIPKGDFDDMHAAGYFRPWNV
jgi:hypothetical protein